MKRIASGFIYATAMGALIWAIEAGYVTGEWILLGIGVGLGAVVFSVARTD